MEKKIFSQLKTKIKQTKNKLQQKKKFMPNELEKNQKRKFP